MDEGLEPTIAQHFQVVSYMDMESPRDSRDRCPVIILMVHHLKPWGALQQDGEEAIIRMSAYRCRPAISIQDSGHQLCRQSVTAELGDLWWWWGFARGDGDDESRGKLNPVTSHPLCY
uniref:Uncharacterized protein n=1 Tax=Oryza punctata TaxID=4537 RepID=A0A0E0KWH2_ORYPU